jgi:hypothetical protein
MVVQAKDREEFLREDDAGALANDPVVFEERRSRYEVVSGTDAEIRVASERAGFVFGATEVDSNGSTEGKRCVVARHA